MAINNELIKDILQQLYDIRPGVINENDDDARDKILPDYKKKEERETIKNHLDYLKDRQYVSFEKWAKSRDYPEGKLKNIKITDKGENFLLSF